MPKVWQAAEARHQFTELVNAAVHGEPQFVERRDGTAAVVVSREYFEKTRPTLKDVLLYQGFAEDDDAFDQALRDIRREGNTFVRPGPVNFEE
jgi:prevent-host-death family protein